MTGAAVSRVRVKLPAHLRTLAHIDGEVLVEVDVGDGEAVTALAVLDVLEVRYPMLRGTIRDQRSGTRRAFVRFFACERDLSHDPMDTPLPEAVVSGAEPLLIIGAMAGG